MADVWCKGWLLLHLCFRRLLSSASQLRRFSSGFHLLGFFFFLKKFEIIPESPGRWWSLIPQMQSSSTAFWVSLPAVECSPSLVPLKFVIRSAAPISYQRSGLVWGAQHLWHIVFLVPEIFCYCIWAEKNAIWGKRSLCTGFILPPSVLESHLEELTTCDDWSNNFISVNKSCQGELSINNVFISSRLPITE